MTLMSKRELLCSGECPRAVITSVLFERLVQVSEHSKHSVSDQGFFLHLLCTGFIRKDILTWSSHPESSGCVQSPIWCSNYFFTKGSQLEESCFTGRVALERNELKCLISKQ